MQQWSKFVWFPQGIPRFSFITWLAVKDRLSTGSRTTRWGQGQICIFCGDPNETRDHLFFSCPYTFTLWIEVVGSLIQPDPDWVITLEQLANRSLDNLSSVLLRLAFQVTIYYVWREHNDRKHIKPAKHTHYLARVVDKTIRNCIMSTR